MAYEQDKPKGQRIEYFDLLKGIAIFLVVMGHALTMCIRQIDAAFIFKIIGEIHMPVFFFISGYLTYKVSQSRTFVAPALVKRFKQLIIPFIIVSALWIWYFPHSHLLSPISSNLADMYCSYWKDGYWFTLCLFELFLIYYPLSAILSHLSKLWQQTAVIFLVYIGLIVLSSFVSFPDENFDIAGIGLLTSFFPVFMIGVMAHRFNGIFQSICKNSYWFVGAVIIFSLSWYSLVYPWELPWLPSWSALIARPVEHTVLIIITVAAIEPWSKKEYSHLPDSQAKPSVIARYFNFLGNESLSIYLLHYFFLFPLTPLQEPLKALGLPFVPLAVIAMVVAFAVIAATLFINYLIKRNNILSFLLIGK